MRWHVGVILFALAACDTEAPSCDSTQYKLKFDAVDTQPNEYVDSDTYAYGPIPVAVGGTERFTVAAIDGCGSAWGPGRLIVSDIDRSVANVTATNATIDIQGLAPGTAAVDAIDELVMQASLHVGVRSIESVQLVADEIGEPGAFFVGIPQVKVKLIAGSEWLVARDLTVAGDIPQGNAWNVLDTAGAAVGDHALMVNVGAASWPVKATIVDHIDDIVAGEPTSAVPNGSVKVCFVAHAGGALVAGVPWTFDFEPGGGRVDSPSCIVVWASNKQETSTMVTAHALGMSATTTVTFTR